MSTGLFIQLNFITYLSEIVLYSKRDIGGIGVINATAIGATAKTAEINLFLKYKEIVRLT